MKRKQPLIGVLSLYDTDRQSMWMLPGYMEGIIAAGGNPLILPITAEENLLNQLAEELDGFLFTGGQDVDPRIYGREILTVCEEISPQRDAMEVYLLKKCIELDKPVFGICRGLQLLNAVLGGSLYQDITAQAERVLDIQHLQKLPPECTVHSVNIKRGTKLYECLGCTKINVNSLHHQAIRKLSPNLIASATSADGLVECAEMKNASFVMAVQWHPELTWKQDDYARKLFHLFVEKCRA